MAATVKRALHYLVFKGTVREGNYGTRVVAFLKKTIEDRGNKATVIGNVYYHHQFCVTTLKERAHKG